MTQTDPDYVDETEDETPLARRLRGEISKRDEKLKEAEARAARAEQLERELAFRDAGINPKDPKASYFVKGYDGEINVEKIREAATEAGFLEPPKPSVSDEELAGHDRINAAAAGATIPNGKTAADVKAEMVEALDKGGPDGLMRYMQANGMPTAWDEQ